MNEQGLVSKYTVTQFKPSKTLVNESEVGNKLNRAFNQDEALREIVSDLTYVLLKQKWHYICVLVDLYNREIIGYSTGPRKFASLIQRVFSTVKYNINHLKFFHTNRGNEFKNQFIDQILDIFSIERSLSEKG